MLQAVHDYTRTPTETDVALFSATAAADAAWHQVIQARGDCYRARRVTPALEAAKARCEAADHQLVATPAATLIGIALKLRRLAAALEVEDSDRPVPRDIATSMIADVERMMRRADA